VTPALGAFLEGWRRAARAPWLVLGIVAITVALSLPFGVMLHREIRTDLGASGIADELLGDWHDEWAVSFSTRGTSLARTFTHEILGFGGTLAALDRVVAGRTIEAPLAIAVALYLAIWIFLTGGVIGRLATAAPQSWRQFLELCRRYFWRVARLGVLTGMAHFAVFGVVRPFLLDTLLSRAIGVDAAESRVIVWRAVGYAVVLALAGLVTLVADFARARLVVEDRRSAIGAIVAGARFVGRRFGRSAGLFLLNVLSLAVLARLWLQVSGGAEGSLWVIVLFSQVYLAARITGRLGFIASEIVFLQGELAHATYLAPPAAAWPKSLSVDALRRRP
jgi:hypothetical protein